MKHFILKLLLFFSIMVALVIIGLLLPATPYSKTSFLASKLNKDELLKNTPSPRLIFIGGSNLSLGLNSQTIKNELQVNPINTSIVVHIGLAYLTKNSLKYVRAGDIVVISPEYEYFYDNHYYGEEALLWTVLDIAPQTITDLNWRQWRNIYKYLPKYAFSKFNPYEYRFHFTGPNFTAKESYNEYGDGHTMATQKKFEPLKEDNRPERFDYFVIDELLAYENELKTRGARLYFTFPGIQDKSFDSNKLVIKKVESELKKNGFKVLGNPDRYIMPDKLMFDSPYHLLEAGINRRTKLLIEDLRPYINLTNIK